MSCLLHIETSTSICSVALSNDGKIFFERISLEGLSHSALAGAYVEEAITIMKRNGLKPDAIAVSGGPGSYTGLRIGVSMAKGLCFGYDIPLISVPTLEIMADMAIEELPAPLYCAMIDARRMEVYAAIFDGNRRLVRETMAEVITGGAYDAFLSDNRVCFFGDGAAKCRDIITSPNAVFIDGICPLASNMVQPAEELFSAGKFEDTAYYEPFYLKEFMATTPGNNIFTDNNNP